MKHKKTIAGWTSKEVAILKKEYPTKHVEDIAKELNKSISTIMQNAAFLKIRRLASFTGEVKFGKGTFSEYETEYIKRWYSKDGPSAIGWVLNRRYSAIRKHAVRLGLSYSGKEKLCREKDCNKLAYIKGYCFLHYTRRKRAGKFSKEKCIVDGCKKKQYLRNICYFHYKEKYRKGELSNKKCSIEGCVGWAHTRGLCRDHYRFLEFFGIAYEEYKELLNLQNNVCGICGKPETKMSRCGTTTNLSIDHVHGFWICRSCGYKHKKDIRPKECPECGASRINFRRKIRGLLCNKCNNAIGLMGDNLKKIMEGITKYRSTFVEVRTVLDKRKEIKL